jgi:hypothetical protein
MIENTIWKDIPGYEGFYQASDKGGLIRSVDRIIIYQEKVWSGKERRARFKGRILVNTIDPGIQYFKVRVRVPEGRPGGASQLTHRLIALAHCERKAGCDFVNHLDGNKLNNDASNLEWTTSSDNQFHALRTGLKRRNTKGLLTDDDVKQIRSTKKYYGYIDDLSEKYGVARPTISAIRNRTNWKHI